MDRRREKDNEKQSNAEELARYAGSLRKADSSISLLVQTFDSVSHLQKIAYALVDSMRNQLQLQKLNLARSGDLLFKNEEIVQKETDIFQRVDRMVNPLFPIDLEYDITIPFSDHRVAPIVAYFNNLRDLSPKQSDKSIAGMARMWPIDKDTVNGFIVGRMDSILKTLPNYYQMDRLFNQVGFIMSIVKGVDKFSDITQRTPQLHFSVTNTVKGQTVRHKQRWMVDLESQCFRLTEKFTGLEFISYASNSNMSFGFNDLKDCAVIIFPQSYLNYTLTSLELITPAGLNQQAYIDFSDKDRLMLSPKIIADFYTAPARSPQAIYFHRMKARDLSPDSIYGPGPKFLFEHQYFKF